MNDGGVVLQFVVVLNIGTVSDLIPSSCERSQHETVGVKFCTV